MAQARKPGIDLRQGQVSIMKDGQKIFLPYSCQGCENNTEIGCLRVLCSAKAFAQEIKFQWPAFLEILKAAKLEEVDSPSW